MPEGNDVLIFRNPEALDRLGQILNNRPEIVSHAENRLEDDDESS